MYNLKVFRENRNNKFHIVFFVLHFFKLVKLFALPEKQGVGSSILPLATIIINIEKESAILRLSVIKFS